jgi:serine/threonine protein kinase
MAKGKLRPNQERLFNFLALKSIGDIFSGDEILKGTGWKLDTLATYGRKHHLDPFLSKLADGSYRCLRDGSTISKGEVSSAFTQVRPGQLVLTKDVKFIGKIQEYRLNKYIGEGAVAHVWEATGLSDGQDYALKVVNPRPDLLEPTRLENVRQRFAREAKYGRKIIHENIVVFCDDGEYNGHPFITMKLAENTVSKILKMGPLDLEKSIEIILACANGLEHLHGEGCIHRDVKPANILKFGSRFVLGDLGIVRWSDMNPAFTSAATITRASVQLGSWYYMAPEQRKSPHRSTPLSDIYALGITWYEILTGETSDPAEVAAKSYAAPTSNRDANKLISEMLEYRPSLRPNAKELKERIEKLRNPEIRQIQQLSLL